MAIERNTRSVDEVLTDIKRQFGDESGVQINDADIIRWVNSAQREISITNTNVNAATAIADINANQAAYPLQSDPNLSDILTIHSIHYDGAPLENLTFQEAQKYIIANKNKSASEPTLWYEYSGIIHLYPSPARNVPQGLHIFVTKAPKRITDKTDILGVPDSYYNAVVQFCLSQAYEQDENMQFSQLKISQFEKSLGIQQERTLPQEASFPTIRVEPEDL